MSQPITKIRHSETSAVPLLRQFVFNPRFAPIQAPRGIDPAIVANFILSEVKPESSWGAYRQTLELIRFYETSDVVSELRKALTRTESGEDGIGRSACILQTIGEVSDETARTEAARYLDERLASLASALSVVEALLEAHVALAPSHTLALLEARIAREMEIAAAHEMESEATMAAFDRLQAIQFNNVPHADALAKKKVSMIGLPSTQRTQELVEVYLGQSTATGQLIETWAGRMLRREAFEGNPGPVFSALEQAMDAAEKAALPSNQLDFIVCRASDAIIYLGGSLSAHHAQLDAKVETRTVNFLWDDP